jgi:hypothetical protein
MASREYASMVGGGFYNQFSSGQLRAALLAVPDLADAVLAVAKFKKSKNTADKIVINMADFGSSEGRNSIAVFVDTFTQLKDKLDAAIEISVTHTDVPTNDYNELFKHVHTSSYLKGNLCQSFCSLNETDLLLKACCRTRSTRWLQPRHSTSRYSPHILSMLDFRQLHCIG